MVMPPNQRNISWKKQILFSFVIIFLLLGALELGIRTWAFFFRTSYERYNFATRRPELVPNIRYSPSRGREFLINSKGFVGPEFAEHPPAGVYRIIALGDSCTFTTGIWNVAYPAILQSSLNSAEEPAKFEVINAGIEGYNSSFALARIKGEIIAYKPKLVTIYIGWNDLMKVNPDNLSDTGKYSVLAAVLDESYIVKALKKLIFIYLRPWLFQPKVANDEFDFHIYDKFVPSLYHDNLKSMIELLRQNKIEVMLFTLPTVVHRGMTRDQLQRHNVFLPYFAGTYSIDKFLSLHRAYNRVIRAVGQENGVPVVDLDEIFNQHDKNELFWDTMHPNEKGNLLIASSLYAKLQEMRLERSL
jgi:lysophospholipase L1-like esterase